MELLGEVLLEADVEDEVQRLKAELGQRIKERDKYHKVGIGNTINPRWAQANAAVKAVRDQLNLVRERSAARTDIEAGRKAMQAAPPPAERPKRKPTTLKGSDLEAAIRMAVEEMAQNEFGEMVPGTVSGEDIHDWIRKNLGEEVARTTIDRHLSNNPALKDLERYRKVGRTAGTTDLDRMAGYFKRLKKQY